MDPSFGSLSEGVLPTSTSSVTSNNLPIQTPIYTHSNETKKNVPIAAIKPVVKLQQKQKPPSRVQNWNQWKTPSNQQTDSEHQEIFNRNYVTTNTVENVLRKTSLTKRLDADMFRYRADKIKPTPKFNQSTDKEKNFHQLESEVFEYSLEKETAQPQTTAIARTEILKADVTQRPVMRRSIPPPVLARRCQSYSDLPDQPASSARNMSEKKNMQDALEKYVINKQGRRSFEKQQSFDIQHRNIVYSSSSSQNDEAKKSTEDMVSLSSNSSTSPDRNIRQRIEVLPSGIKSPQCPLKVQPYIRSTFQTVRIKPLKDRSASQPSLTDTRIQHNNRLSDPCDTNLARKKSDTRVRYPIVVPNDEHGSQSTPKYCSNRSPSPQHQSSTEDSQSPLKSVLSVGDYPFRFRNNHDRTKERPVSCRYSHEYEPNCDKIISPVEWQAMSRSEENMLQPKYCPQPPSDSCSSVSNFGEISRDNTSENSINEWKVCSSSEQLRDHDMLPNTGNIQRFQELDNLISPEKEKSCKGKRNNIGSNKTRRSVSEIVSKLGESCISGNSGRKHGALKENPINPSNTSNNSFSHSIPKTLHSISEFPILDQKYNDISPYQITPLGLDRSEPSVTDSRHLAPQFTQWLTPKESFTSLEANSEVRTPDLPNPNPNLLLKHKERICLPDDIKLTMQKISNSSRDSESDIEIEQIPEPATDKLPEAYFQPNFIVGMRLKLNADSRSESEQESSSSHEGTERSRLCDKQYMIRTHEEAVINFTCDREQLIKESRQNEKYGEAIIHTIKTKCPSILGKLQAFVEDIQSNYKLAVQLNGRIIRAEAAAAEATNLDSRTKEVCEQKIKSLRAQQLEAGRLNNHCIDRERFVTDFLRQNLNIDDFLKFERYVTQKRTILKEQYMIEERIKGAELLLKQLKES